MAVTLVALAALRPFRYAPGSGEPGAGRICAALGVAFCKGQSVWPAPFVLDSRIQGVVPFHLPAAISSSEAVLGQFCRVVLVAGLVSVYSQKRGPTR